MNSDHPTNQVTPWRFCRTWIIAPILVAIVSTASAAAPNGTGTHNDLINLFEDFQEWKSARWRIAMAAFVASGNSGYAIAPGSFGPNPQSVDAIPDYSVAAVGRRRAELRLMQQSMEDMSVRHWSVPEQVDYLTVRAELDKQDFILQVTRPWARDPVFYIANLFKTAFTELPADGKDLKNLQRQLRASPATLSAARNNLTDVAADYADLAIRTLTTSDGVEDGYPHRAEPPAGVIGWYEDLLARAETQPELKPDISAAITAISHFQSWLTENRASMNGENGVGKEALDWFVQNALLIPYTSNEIAVLAQRELDRLWAFYALEQHRNRNLPELSMASSREEYQQRIAETDQLVRDFLVDDSFITIPDYIPNNWKMMLVGSYKTGYNVPWIVRKTPPNFWEQVQFRDPAPDHLHAVIPGHRFDAMVAARNPNTIRAQVNFGGRWQGWAVYLEEAPLQAGILNSRPRTRELIYLFGLWRAARALGDIYNQWNEMTASETADYWMDMTPLMDPNVARKYAYLRPAPGHGIEYTIGNIQMFQLLGDRKRQLTDKFVLRDFHDEFISKGRIPIALIRYEMTGYKKDVESFWNRQPLSSVLMQ
jgi:hypothetical protein